MVGGASPKPTKARFWHRVRGNSSQWVRWGRRIAIESPSHGAWPRHTTVAGLGAPRPGAQAAKDERELAPQVLTGS
jgi:hypothetical protein